MTFNVGGLDRTLRILVGLALVVAAATGTVGIWAYVGLIPLVTGLLGWCPLYAVLGFKTCRTGK